ncbi:MAG: hypothetical protein IJ697_02815 [Synergistaceae bacterium]|nr:hypothetical protein [Synergistaceae bacterium]
MRIYLDNCCYNRPYDDQSQIRISLETQAKLFIQKQVESGRIELVSSYVLTAENSMNRILSKQENIRNFISRNSKYYVSISHKNEIENIAAEIMLNGVKFIDACHVACAVFAECGYFLSTDYRLLKYKTDKIKLLNPIDFLLELGA